MYWQSVRDLQNDLYRLGNFIRINGHRNRCSHVGIGFQIRRQKTKITIILFHQSRKLELFAIFGRYTGLIIHFHDERHPTVFGGRKCNRNIKARCVRINVHCQLGFTEPGGGQLRCRALLFTSYQYYTCKKDGQYTFSAHDLVLSGSSHFYSQQQAPHAAKIRLPSSLVRSFTHQTLQSQI